MVLNWCSASDSACTASRLSLLPHCTVLPHSCKWAYPGGEQLSLILLRVLMFGWLFFLFFLIMWNCLYSLHHSLLCHVCYLFSCWGCFMCFKNFCINPVQIRIKTIVMHLDFKKCTAKLQMKLNFHQEMLFCWTTCPFLHPLQVSFAAVFVKLAEDF